MGGKRLAQLCANVHEFVQYWRSVLYRLEKPEFVHTWESFSEEEQARFEELILEYGKRDEAFAIEQEPERSVLELSYRELRDMASRLGLKGVYKLNKDQLMWRLIDEQDSGDPSKYQSYETALREVRSKAYSPKKDVRDEAGGTDGDL